MRITNSKPSGPVLMIDQSEIRSSSGVKFIIVFSASVRLYSGFSQHERKLCKNVWPRSSFCFPIGTPSVSLLGQNPDIVWLGFEILNRDRCFLSFPQAISFVFFFCTTISCFLRCVIIDRRLGCFFLCTFFILPSHGVHTSHASLSIW